MPYKATQIANYFIEKSGRSLSHIQIMKMVYFAHGWKLALQGQPLISDGIQAWEYGPVIPSLYNELKKYGAGTVTEPIKGADSDQIGVEDRQLLDRIYEVYGKLEPFQLSALTHQPGTPWSQVMDKWQRYKGFPIPNDLIKAHFDQLKQDGTRKP